MLPERARLAERIGEARLADRHEHAGTQHAFLQRPPLLFGEIGLRRHHALLSGLTQTPVSSPKYSITRSRVAPSLRATLCDARLSSRMSDTIRWGLRGRNARAASV